MKLWAAPQTAASIGAYIARSYAGDETQLWLNGFAETEDDGALAFVVLLEDTDDVAHVIALGRELFDNLTSANE